MKPVAASQQRPLSMAVPPTEPSEATGLLIEISCRPGMRDMLTLPDAAREVGMDARTLRHHIDQGEIVPVYTGGRNIERIPRWMIVLWQVGKAANDPLLVKRVVDAVKNQKSGLRILKHENANTPGVSRAAMSAVEGTERRLRPTFQDDRRSAVPGT